MDNIVDLEKYKLMSKLKEMADTMSKDSDDHILDYYKRVCDEFTSIMYQIENFKIRKPDDFDIFKNMNDYFMDNILFFFALQDEIVKRELKNEDECEVGKLCHSFMHKIPEISIKVYEEAKEHFNKKG